MVEDLRFALRMLVKNWGFSLAAGLVLALGIGANSAVFSVVNTVLLRPLPYKDPDRLVWLWGRDVKRGIPYHFIPYADLVEWRAQAKSFESMSAYWPQAVNLRTPGAGDPERITVMLVNAGFLHLAGVAPMLGRDFTEAEDQPGAARVVLLSYGFWQRRFGSDRGIIGRPVELDGAAATVIGVLPSRFRVAHNRPDAYLPLAKAAARSGPDRFFSTGAFARLKAGVSRAQAQAETDLILGRPGQLYFGKPGRGVRIWGVREFLVRDVRLSLMVLLGAVALVLLIGCVNLANLMLARAAARRRELAIRAALGATRMRLLRGMLLETALLGLCGGALGLFLAGWGVRALAWAAPAQYPFIAETRVDVLVLWFTLLISLGTGLVFGLAPALSLSGGNMQETLRGGGKGTSAGPRQNRVQRVLIGSEVALASVLAMTAGLLIRGFIAVEHTDPGFRANGVFTAGISLPAARYPGANSQTAFYDRLQREAASVPGVQAAGLVSVLPLSGVNTGAPVVIEGRPAQRPEEIPTAWLRSANGGYFRAMLIPLRRGRLFEERDTADSLAVALVNGAMARRFWPGENPVGKRFAMGASVAAAAGHWLTVIGVVGSVRHTALAQPPEPEFFLPYTQRPQAAMWLAVRANGDPVGLAAALRRAVRSVDPDVPLADGGPLEDALVASTAPERLTALLFGIFACLAVALAVVGVYSVVSVAMARRKREMGIRLALGAEKRDVLLLVLAQGMVPVLGGLAAGFVLTASAGQVMRALLGGTFSGGALVLGGTAALLLLAAAFATYVPAQRAVKLDAVSALRSE